MYQKQQDIPRKNIDEVIKLICIKFFGSSYIFCNTKIHDIPESGKFTQNQLIIVVLQIKESIVYIPLNNSYFHNSFYVLAPQNRNVLWECENGQCLLKASCFLSVEQLMNNPRVVSLDTFNYFMYHSVLSLYGLCFDSNNNLAIECIRKWNILMSRRRLTWGLSKDKHQVKR